jgi:hypothetical protein
MIQTLGPAGSDPVANAKFTIIRNYIETSGAFNYDSTTGNYTMNGNDAVYMWTDTIYNVQRGYQLAVNKPISTQELESGQFDSQTFKVVKYWASGGALGQWQESTMFTLTKMQFFDLWLGQKLQPTAYGADQPDPSGFTRLNSLASDFSVFLSKDKNYFETDSGAQTFSAKVRGLLDTATKIGFPTPQGALEQLADFVNGIISAVWSLITAVWDVIVNFVGSVANFLLAVWNNIVGPVLGAAIEVVKTIVTLEIEFVKTLFNILLNTPTTTVNPEETKTFVTQQLFKQNTVQTFQGIYNSQESIEISSDPFGPLLEFMPAIQPLMQISSIGSLLSSFIQLPQLLIDLINIIGSGGLMSIIFEVVNAVVTQAIQVLFDRLVAPLMNDFLNLISIDTLFSTEEISFLETVIDYGIVDPNFNFNEFYSKVMFLPLQIFETIKGIPIISTAFGLLINGTIDIISGVIGYIQFILSIGSSLQSYSTSTSSNLQNSAVSTDFNVLSSIESTESNLQSVAMSTESTAQSTFFSIDTDLLSSFAFQLVSRLLFSYATYITYDINTNPNPINPSDYNFNRGILWKELALDILGIQYSITSYIFADRLNSRYPDGRFGHVSTYTISLGLTSFGELLEDFSKFAIYSIYPADSITIKKVVVASSIGFVIGNLAKVGGSLSYGFLTSLDKLGRFINLSLAEGLGTIATLINTLINLYIGSNSLIFGIDFVNKVKLISEYKKLLSLFPEDWIISSFSKSMKNLYFPINLGNISKKTYLLLTGVSFGLDILLFTSACFIEQ